MIESRWWKGHGNRNGWMQYRRCISTKHVRITSFVSSYIWWMLNICSVSKRWELDGLNSIAFHFSSTYAPKRMLLLFELRTLIVSVDSCNFIGVSLLVHLQVPSNWSEKYFESLPWNFYITGTWGPVNALELAFPLHLLCFAIFPCLNCFLNLLIQILGFPSHLYYGSRETWLTRDSQEYIGYRLSLNWTFKPRTTVLDLTSTKSWRFHSEVIGIRRRDAVENRQCKYR